MGGGNYFDQALINGIRRNIKKYDWAEELSLDSIKKADILCGYGKKYWWTLPTPNELARVATPGHLNSGCPKCGEDHKIKYGNAGWINHIQGNLWKVECKNCGSVYPSNDFKSYYDSGLDKNGIFKKDLADPAFLVNTMYPEKGPDYFVDDGTGYMDETGNRWSFIGYYIHYGLWANWNDDDIDGGIILTAAKKLSEAYIYTGNIKYAQYCLLILYKVALVYPELDLNVWMRIPGRQYRNTDGFSLQGKATGRICEAILSRILCTAADAVLPVLREYKSETEEFFSEFAIINANQIHNTIIDGIIRQIYIGVQNGSIGGNEGMYQSALAIAAVCMGECDESKTWLDWLFADGEVLAKSDPVRKRIEHKTGGNIFGILVNKVNGDGFGNECSPTYNRIWLIELSRIADILSKYPGIQGTKYDIRTHPIMKKMYRSYTLLNIDNDYIPKNGDTGKTGNPMKVFTEGFAQKILLSGYYATEDTKILDYFNVCYPKARDGRFGFIEIEDPEKIASMLQKAQPPQLPLHTKSHNFTDYGDALLRQSTRTGCNVHVYYGRTMGHGHLDKMNFEIIANKLNCTPDLGYPEYAEQFAKRFEWTSHTISHNTVLVDSSAQKNTEYAGEPYGYEDSKIIKFIDVDDPNVYEQTKIYRRSVCMVEISQDRAYFIDIFRVAGGKVHQLSFHGGEGEVNIKGINLSKQVSGTLQGEDIDFGVRKERKTVMFDSELGRGTGYHYLYDISKCDKACNYSELTYTLKDTWNQREGMKGQPYLKAYMLTETDQTVICKGQPPVNKIGNPEYLYYYLGRRQGEDLCSRFTSVYEPYVDINMIESVELVPVDGNLNDFTSVCFKIALKNGIIDYFLHSTDENKTIRTENGIEFKGALGFIRLKQNKVIHSFISKATKLTYENKPIFSDCLSYISGVVRDFQKSPVDCNFIDLIMDANQNSLSNINLKNRFIYINGNGFGNASYEIRDVLSVKSDEIKIIIDESPVRKYINIKNQNDGYIYRFNEGAKFIIPLSYTYSSI